MTWSEKWQDFQTTLAIGTMRWRPSPIKTLLQVEHCSRPFLGPWAQLQGLRVAVILSENVALISPLACRINSPRGRAIDKAVGVAAIKADDYIVDTNHAAQKRLIGTKQPGQAPALSSRCPKQLSQPLNSSGQTHLSRFWSLLRFGHLWCRKPEPFQDGHRRNRIEQWFVSSSPESAIRWAFPPSHRRKTKPP
ncbi:hypothetical protein C8034_v008467 [Colletotrichum sidae]|uniref:Uncharacterized protein n=1 Tax=Colletotrichum sidae TaxID=1347389 RepID=A0A4R8T331_9PEZI|nr:hypothetical protein C8034_v008467 [Colletotrichum sidae]